MIFHGLLKWSFVGKFGSILGHSKDRIFDGSPTLTSSHMATCPSDISGPEPGKLSLTWALQRLLMSNFTPNLHVLYHSIFYKS